MQMLRYLETIKNPKRKKHSRDREKVAALFGDSVTHLSDNEKWSLWVLYRENPQERKDKLLQKILCRVPLSTETETETEIIHKKENNKIRQVFSDAYKCARCGVRKTTFQEVQTRSADESMTVFIQCAKCNHRWRES